MRIVYILFVVFLTTLLTYDYFNVLSEIIVISNSTFIFIFIGLIIVSLIFERKKEVNNSKTLKWQIFIVVYIIALMVLFSLLGGESTVGISFSNPLFWIVLGIALLDILFDWKRRTKS